MIQKIERDFRQSHPAVAIRIVQIEVNLSTKSAPHASPSETHIQLSSSPQASIQFDFRYITTRAVHLVGITDIEAVDQLAWILEPRLHELLNA